MFKKFASNILQDLSDECHLKSFVAKHPEDQEMYRSIAERIDLVIKKLAVETFGEDSTQVDVE
jgi:hypothetical protein